MKIASATITFINADGSEHIWSASRELDPDELIDAILEFDREDAIAEAEL